MRILNCRPVANRGSGRFRDVAIFDVEINDGLKLKGLKLSKAPDGKLFVFSPSSHGLTFASFNGSYALQIATAAHAALTGGDVAHDHHR